MKNKHSTQSKKSLITEEIVKTSLSRIETVEGVPIALILPSGITQNTKILYAAGLKQFEGAALDHLILIGQKNPKDRDQRIYIKQKGHLETPVGKIEIDTSLAESLTQAHPDQIHLRDSETFVQFNPILPFIKLVCPSAKVLPALLEPGGGISAQEFSQTLADALANQNGAIIAFSNVDDTTLSALEFSDLEILLKLTPQGQDQIHPKENVSFTALAAALQFAQRMGSNIMTMLKSVPDYDLDTNTTIHQASIMLWKYWPPTFTQSQQNELIALAKNAIHNYIAMREVPVYKTDDPTLLRKCGVFVTLRQKNMLRGCIGRMQADLPLYKAVQEMAISAATADPRFPPIRSEELDELSFKIAVLSPLKRITKEEIEVGTHGLLISHQGRRGVLLPEVPVERGWSKEMFLDNLCLKASLPTRILQENPALYAFTAVGFGS